MHRSIAGLALLVLPLAASPASAQKPNAAQFGWLNDYAAARTEARKTGKPIMLVFRCEP
jgi:hypothetical protein